MPKLNLKRTSGWFGESLRHSFARRIGRAPRKVSVGRPTLKVRHRGKIYTKQELQIYHLGLVERQAQLEREVIKPDAPKITKERLVAIRKELLEVRKKLVK